MACNNEEGTKFAPKTPTHGCDPMLKLFEPQLYEPTRMTFVTRFQRNLYSGGRIRVQSVEDMGQFEPDPVNRADDMYYVEQLQKFNEPWEMLYTYPYQPKVFECYPTADQQFNDRDQYDTWRAEKHPDLLCPPEFRKEHTILKAAETVESAEGLAERVETTPSYGFASRNTMSRRRRSIDLTMLNVQETRVRYTGTKPKLLQEAPRISPRIRCCVVSPLILTGAADERDFDIEPTFNFDTSGGIPAGLTVTRVAQVEDLLDADPAQRAGVIALRDRLVSIVSASGMHHVLVKSVLTPETIENHRITMNDLFDGIIYGRDGITLIFWGERNVLKDERYIPEVAETFTDPATGVTSKIWDRDVKLRTDEAITQLFIVPGKEPVGLKEWETILAGGQNSRKAAAMGCAAGGCSFKQLQRFFGAGESRCRGFRFPLLMEVDDFVVLQLWVMPGKGDSYLRVESERYNATRSTFMLSCSNDASYYMNSTDMKLTYPLPTTIIPGRAMGGRAPPISVVLAEIDVQLYNVDRNLYFENDFLSGNRTWFDSLRPPLYNDIRIWNRLVMQLIFGDDIFVKITNNEVTTDRITEFVVKEVMTQNIWLRNNLLLDEYYPMTEWLSDENKIWIVYALNAGTSAVTNVAGGAAGSGTGLSIMAPSLAGSKVANNPFGIVTVQNVTTLPPYNYTCQPNIWAHVLEICPQHCRALVSGLRDFEGKEPPLAQGYRTCDNYCLAQQSGYECVLAAEEKANPTTGLPSCNIQGEYGCDFDFGLYTDDAICECRPTTTTTTTPPPPPPPIPKVRA
eukprot:g12126.t1